MLKHAQFLTAGIQSDNLFLFKSSKNDVIFFSFPSNFLFNIRKISLQIFIISTTIHFEECNYDFLKETLNWKSVFLALNKDKF